MPCRPHEARGFTLVELMVIIGVIGLIAAIGVPTFNGYLRANILDTTADRVASDMALARTLSVSQGQVFQFIGTAAGYQIIDSSDASIIRDRTFEGTVQLDADYTVNFYPWGAADTSTLTLDTGAEARRVLVLPTGIAEVQHCP
jgi:type IV fimbrial biogenesis protein FimT